MSCCPHLRTPSPRSSTHPGTPAHTLCISGGTLKKRTALSLKLPPVFLALVEFEATARILSGDNATFMLHLRVGAACFAALDVLSVGAYESVCRVEATTGVSRACARRGTTVSPSPCHGLVMCTRIGCVNTFSERARAKRARMSAPPSGSGT